MQTASHLNLLVAHGSTSSKEADWSCDQSNSQKWLALSLARWISVISWSPESSCRARLGCHWSTFKRVSQLACWTCYWHVVQLMWWWTLICVNNALAQTCYILIYLTDMPRELQYSYAWERIYWLSHVFRLPGRLHSGPCGDLINLKKKCRYSLKLLGWKVCKISVYGWPQSKNPGAESFLGDYESLLSITPVFDGIFRLLSFGFLTQYQMKT